MSYTPLMMKKGRPGWALELIVPAGRGAEFARSDLPREQHDRDPRH